MHNHYAGNWYPYQDEKGHNPGVIIDPKSPVVVGAAIEFMARHGMLPQFKFDMKGRTHENTYYWGVMTDATSGIRPERILFEPVTEQSREDITEFPTSSQRVLIGRKLSGDEGAQATPGLSLEDRSGRPHRADADHREDQTQARHEGPGRDPRDRPGQRRRGRRRRRARRERVLLAGGPWPTSAITSTPADWTILKSETADLRFRADHAGAAPGGNALDGRPASPRVMPRGK